MENKPNILNSTMRNGLILGIFFSLNFIFSMLNKPYLGLLSNLILALIIYLTYRFTVRFRDKENAGVISFGRGFLYVFLLFFFASIISAGVKYIYLQFVDTELLSNILNMTMQTMEQVMPNVPDDMYDTAEKMLTPINYVLMTSWSNLLASLFLGIIIGLIVRKEEIFTKRDN